MKKSNFCFYPFFILQPWKTQRNKETNNYFLLKIKKKDTVLIMLLQIQPGIRIIGSKS